MQELQHWRAEHEEALAAAAELETGCDIELQDARLLQVRLAAIVQRYKDRAPSVEDVAKRYEGELEELETEVRALRDDNVRLATGSSEALGTDVAITPKVNRGRRALTVVEELCEEAHELRPVQLQVSKRQRHTKIGEWTLAALKGDTKKTSAKFQAQEHRLEDLRKQHIEAEAHLKQLLEEQQKLEKELDVERVRVRDLHCQALAMREASFVPAKLKKDTTFLLKVMDHDGGRLKTRQHLRSVEACKRLYLEVAHAAPSLLPLVGRVKADMEEEFARYLQLEGNHGSALQRLQLAVTRSLRRPHESSFQD